MYVILSNLEKLTKIWLLHRPSQLLYEGTSLRYFAPEPRIDLKSISTVYTWLTHLFNRQLSPAQEFWKVTEMRKIKTEKLEVWLNLLVKCLNWSRRERLARCGWDNAWLLIREGRIDILVILCTIWGIQSTNDSKKWSLCRSISA